MIKIGTNFLFYLSSRAMLLFEHQHSPTCIDVDLRLCFPEGSPGHNTVYWHLIVVWWSICISWLWPWSSYCDLESFPDTSKVIYVFKIQIKFKNYIAKNNTNAKTESCLNPNSCHCYYPEPMWRRDYTRYNVEFVAAIEKSTWSYI